LAPVADIVALSVPPGLRVGRFGNFLNNELIGKPTTVPWAIIYDAYDDIPRHPSQLYELTAEGIITGAIYGY
jgi:phosphatidylglycerol:prolipoprotein diacylglycerol transferase